jgi:hypothetical protein
MSLPLAQVVLYAALSFSAGGALVWRLLGRGHREAGRKLAEELADRVHDRCTAYKRLEHRIDSVIEEFDQREAELRDEAGEPTVSVDAPAVVDTSLGVEVPLAADGGTLSWMDACDRPGDAAPAGAGEAACARCPVPGERTAADTEGAIEGFARRLEDLQSRRSAELELQRDRIEEQERRLQAIEASIQLLARRERAEPEPRRSAAPPAAAAPVAAAAAGQPSLQALCDRIARGERETAAWHALQEKLARKRLADIEEAREIAVRLGAEPPPNAAAAAGASSVRARAEELAREIARLQETITRRAPEPSVAQGPARPEPRPEDPPSQVDTTRAALPAVDPAPDGEATQIGELMRQVEVAREEAETYRRKLRDQSDQFTAAYAMLERIRPFVQALESDFAAHAHRGERSS